MGHQLCAQTCSGPSLVHLRGDAVFGPCRRDRRRNSFIPERVLPYHRCGGAGAAIRFSVRVGAWILKIEASLEYAV